MRRIAVLCTVTMIAQLMCAGCGMSSGGAAQGSGSASSGTLAADEEKELTPADYLLTEEEALASASEEGQILNIYCLGDDFRNRVQDFVPGYEKNGDGSGHFGDVQVQWHVYEDKADYMEDLDDLLGIREEDEEESEDGATDESEYAEESEDGSTEESEEGAAEESEDSATEESEDGATEESEDGTTEESEDASEGVSAQESYEDDTQEPSEGSTEGSTAASEGASTGGYNVSSPEEPAREPVDLFVADESILPHYVRSEHVLEIVGGVGTAEQLLEDQFPYTREEASDESGVQKAVSWHVTPGVFIYRRSIAKEVLGTDDPSFVQEAVSDWDKFEETAGRMSSAGYYMLSGYDDTYQAYADHRTLPWVKDNVVDVDEHMFKWAEQARTFAENEYTHGTEMWSDEWYLDHSGEGNVFGFFDTNQGIRFTLEDKAQGNTRLDDEEDDFEYVNPEDANDEDEEVEDAVGDYGACKGPAAFHQGGSWILAADCGDNPTLTRYIMESLTCNPKIMQQITENIGEFTNSISGMQELSQTPHELEVLSGQDPFPVLLDVAGSITPTPLTEYDDDLNLGFQVSMRDYITGLIQEDTAIDRFYGAVSIRYPDLERPEPEEDEEEEE